MTTTRIVRVKKETTAKDKAPAEAASSQQQQQQIVSDSVKSTVGSVSSAAGAGGIDGPALNGVDYFPGTEDFDPVINGSESSQNWSTSFHGLSTQPFSREISDILMQPVDMDDIEIKPGKITDIMGGRNSHVYLILFFFKTGFFTCLKSSIEGFWTKRLVLEVYVDIESRCYLERCSLLTALLRRMGFGSSRRTLHIKKERLSGICADLPRQICLTGSRWAGLFWSWRFSYCSWRLQKQCIDEMLQGSRYCIWTMASAIIVV